MPVLGKIAPLLQDVAIQSDLATGPLAVDLTPTNLHVESMGIMKSSPSQMGDKILRAKSHMRMHVEDLRLQKQSFVVHSPRVDQNTNMSSASQPHFGPFSSLIGLA